MERNMCIHNGRSTGQANPSTTFFFFPARLSQSQREKIPRFRFALVHLFGRGEWAWEGRGHGRKRKKWTSRYFAWTGEIGLLGKKGNDAYARISGLFERNEALNLGGSAIWGVSLWQAIFLPGWAGTHFMGFYDDYRMGYQVISYGGTKMLGNYLSGQGIFRLGNSIRADERLALRWMSGLC